jgi:hypothetical protein
VNQHDLLNLIDAPEKWPIALAVVGVTTVLLICLGVSVLDAWRNARQKRSNRTGLWQ